MPQSPTTWNAKWMSSFTKQCSFENTISITTVMTLSAWSCRWRLRRKPSTSGKLVYVNELRRVPARIIRTISPKQLDQKIIVLCKIDHSLDWGEYSESVQLESKGKDDSKPISSSKPKPTLRVETGDEAKVYPSTETVRLFSTIYSQNRSKWPVDRPTWNALPAPLSNRGQTLSAKHATWSLIDHIIR